LLGLSKANELLETRDIERDLNNLLLDAEREDEIWIITPYATMDRLSSLKRTIADTAAKGVNISFVVRDEPDQVNPAKKHLKEAINNGLKLYAFKRLHAKVYWFEHSACILTSANLVDGSFESSTEIGLGIPAGRLHGEVFDWINSIIVPGLRELAGASKKAQPKSKAKSNSKSRGYCIRCKTPIDSNLEKPYCLAHYKSWSKYSNDEYEEKYCHVCGKSHKSSLLKPACYRCYKKQ
jgi:phosphatidylserine/phosphatidylglycerophosphate/cardiolipin synthase-like enzyme